MRSLVRQIGDIPSFESSANQLPGLGGGGLATPQVSNITNAITYAMLALCMFLAKSMLLVETG